MYVTMKVGINGNGGYVFVNITRQICNNDQQTKSILAEMQEMGYISQIESPEDRKKAIEDRVEFLRNNGMQGRYHRAHWLKMIGKHRPFYIVTSKGRQFVECVGQMYDILPWLHETISEKEERGFYYSNKMLAHF